MKNDDKKIGDINISGSNTISGSHIGHKITQNFGGEYTINSDDLTTLALQLPNDKIIDIDFVGQNANSIRDQFLGYLNYLGKMIGRVGIITARNITLPPGFNLPEKPISVRERGDLIKVEINTTP
ncbi:hypothetical protein [Gluconobacter cerinus]|uniref:hypothetical protein n=1 Tax=Gluconobacter cerinus TaxID=38307 RepID=UPI003AB11B6A